MIQLINIQPSGEKKKKRKQQKIPDRSDAKKKKLKTELQLKETMCTEDNRSWTIQSVMLPKNLAGFEYKNENTLEVFNWIWERKKKKKSCIFAQS